MFLSALLLAAAVQVAPDPPNPPGVIQGRIMRPAGQGCQVLKVVPVEQPGGGEASPLAQRPPAFLQYAVMRSVGGCLVSTPVRQVRPAR